MKNQHYTLWLLVLLSVCGLSAQAQDTIFGRSDHYYYSCWYDTIPMPDPDSVTPGVYEGVLLARDVESPVDMEGHALVKSDYTPDTLAIKGLVAFLGRHAYDRTFPGCYSDTPPMYDTTDYGPQELLLHKITDTGLCNLASIRWDSVTPKLMQLDHLSYGTSVHTDSTTSWQVYLPVAYIHAYEARFKEPVFVCDSFHIEGTHHEYRPANYPENGGSWWRMRPKYASAYYHYRGYAKHLSSTQTHLYDKQNKCWSRWDVYRANAFRYGSFMAIVDFYNLRGESADSLMGHVEGSGRYSDLTHHRLTAVPDSGYRFHHWNDGSTVNPRSVYVTSDTLLTAHFIEDGSYQAQGLANDNSRGWVSGGGTYLSFDTVTFRAIPWEGYAFSAWHDGDSANPRSFVITQDTSLTAIFLPLDGIAQPEAPAFSLSPNPAQGSFLCLSHGLPLRGTTLTLADAQGKEVLSIPITSPQQAIDASSLLAGIYFATLRSPQGSSTLKLVLAR